MIDHVTQDLNEYLKNYDVGSDKTEQAYQQFESKISKGSFAIVANDTMTIFQTTKSAVHWLDEHYLLNDDSELKTLSTVEKDNLADICDKQGIIFLWNLNNAENYYVNSILSNYPLNLEKAEV